MLDTACNLDTQDEERLRFILEGANDGLWDWNIVTGSTYFSPRWETILGYEVGEIIPYIDGWLSLIHPDDCRAVQRALNDHLSGAYPLYQAEYRLRTKSGSWLWVLGRGWVTSRDDTGAPLRMVGTQTDIHDRKQAEAAQTATMERLKSVLEATSDNVIALDRSWHFTYMNHRARDLISAGYDLQGKSFWSVFPDAMGARIGGELSLAMHGKEPVTLTEFYGPHGKWYALNAYPQADGLVIFFHDITEQKRQELELREARERADVANHAKTEFLGHMSHELRTPLNAIMGFSEMLHLGTMGPLTPAQDGCIQAIYEAGGRMLTLVQDLLDLSQAEYGRMELVLDMVDVTDLLHGCRQLVTESVRTGCLLLEVSVPPHFPTFLGDTLRLRQIILNLLSNAIKFTPPGGLVRLGAEILGESVVFFVQDTGKGMTAAEIDDALHPFHLIRAQIARKRVGVGIGLPLARRLAELHGGMLSIESVPQQGTTVRVIIPLNIA